MKNLYVYNPDTGALTPAKDWMKEKDPTRAQLFGFRSGDGVLLMTKNPIAHDVTFDEAQKLAADFSIEGEGPEVPLHHPPRGHRLPGRPG